MSEYDDAMKQAHSWAAAAEHHLDGWEECVALATMYARIAQAAAVQDVAYWVQNFPTTNPLS